MSSSLRARVAVITMVMGMCLVVVTSAWGAEFGIEKFFAANCKAGFEECGKGAAEPTKKEVEEKNEGFPTASGYPSFGVSDFKVKSLEIEPGVKVPFPESVMNLRVDVAPGVVTNPQVATYCSMKEFEGKLEEP